MDIDDHFRSVTKLAREAAEILNRFDYSRQLAAIDTRLLSDSFAMKDSAAKSLALALEEMAHHQHDFTDAQNHLNAAIGSLKNAFQPIPEIDLASFAAVDTHRQWGEVTKLFADQRAAAAEVLQRHSSCMLATSLGAQSKLMELGAYDLGAVIQADEPLRESLTQSLGGLTTNYSNLIGTFQEDRAAIAKLPPFASARPPLEVFWEVSVLESITVPEEERESVDESEIVIVPEDRPIEAWLNDLDPSLIRLLSGARDALASSNPDRARHVATSLRELFTHILHLLASDRDVEKWTSAPDHFYNGRPTRRARLLYIARTVHFGPLEDFINADVKSALTLVDSLQSGTHGIASRFVESQLRLIIVRMEHLLTLLFHMNAANE